MTKKRSTSPKVKRVGETAYGILNHAAHGHENAIPGKRLRLMVQAISLEHEGGTVHERSLREGIAWGTTEKGYPIASATRPPWGYYIMGPGERKDLRRAMITRVAALARRMRIADSDLAHRLFQLLQQEAGQDFQAEVFR